MSLKGFHILFIALAFLCASGFWAWAYLDQETAAKMAVEPLANLSGSLAIALLIYGLWFVIKKAKTIIV